MGKFARFLAEKAGVKYDYNCLMIDIPKWVNINLPDNKVPDPAGNNAFVNFVYANVKKEDIYHDKDGGKGIETNTHLTLLYGFHQNREEKDLEEIKRLTKVVRPFKIKLGKISKFSNAEFDVLKIDIEPNHKLNSLHYLIKNNIPNDYEFEVYHPHITLSYVKKGSCEDLVGNETFAGIEVYVDSLDFSMKDGSIKNIRLIENQNEIKNLGEDNKINEEPSTVAPTSIENGQFPGRQYVISRKPLKKFSDIYKKYKRVGIGFIIPNNPGVVDSSGSDGSGSGSH